VLPPKSKSGLSQLTDKKLLSSCKSRKEGAMETKTKEINSIITTMEEAGETITGVISLKKAQ
jgi:hypothetical protein